METDRKHCVEGNHAQLDQYAVKSDVKLDTFESDKLQNELTNSRNYETNDGSAMKFNNHESDRYGVNVNKIFKFDEDLLTDDGYMRICELLDNLTANISAVPFSCTMERSNSWEFCSFSSKRVNLQPFCRSTSSSLCSYTEFEKVIRSLEDYAAPNDAIELLSTGRFFTYPPNKNTRIKRSHSDTGVCTDEVQFPVMQLSGDNRTIHYDASCSIDNTNLNGFNSDDESDDGYVACKKRRINCGAVDLNDDDCVNSQADWNRLYVRDKNEPDDIEVWSESSSRLPGQRFIYDAGDSTSKTDVQLRRMRSRSVTLRRTTANSSRQMERSYSIGVMASAIDSEKCCARCEPDDCVRPRSWMRASMRLVRPFQLADPPEPAGQRCEQVQINLPPVFPCDIERPCSAPMPERPRQYGRSGQRRLSSRVSSVSSDSQVSIGTENWDNASESIDNGSVRSESERSAEVPPQNRNEPVSGNATQSSPRPGPASSAGTYEMSQESESPLGQWSHGLSSMLACVGCTLGIFNISRFAIFSIHFGANFILQFLVLTVLIGIPLFTFHISLGQLLGTGVLNMWHISPIFKGIGVALLLSQAFIGIYSIIGVSWMFVYFRDSFISKQDVYRWAEPLELYGEDGVRTLKYNNGSYKIEQTVPDYFSGVVLQRRNVLKQEDDLMNVKFSVAFNLAIVWIIIFLSLSKGLKSYGKVVYVFSILPIFGMTLLCAKLLGFLPGTSKSRNFFPETDWSEFFLNSKSWVAAFTEVFLTWGVFGASAMQITSHNRQKHFLYRDSALVIVITVSVLLLSAFIANMCSQLLEYNNFLYLPSSFERSTTYLFLQRMDIPLPYSYATTPIRWMIHSGLILGERTIKPGTNVIQESGYQPLRLATELVPATFAAIGPKIISPFWSVLFYFIFIMFGISQQMAIWYGVISNIVAINVKALKPCWTTITWFTCIGGFLLGLPMTMETGIFTVYYLDFVIGCGWWIMILYLLQLGAVFIVRGRPYSGETIVATLFTRSNYFLQNWIAPMFSFNWNVILPVTLLLLSTSVFKNGGYRMLYNWHSSKYYEYWPPWSRKCGCLLQILPLFTVPLVGIIQSYLYLTDGPLDLFERIQLLYRPVLENTSNLRNPSSTDTESNNRSSGTNNTNVTVNDDPPPKYTPPPSYSTATGARIAKLLRQSFRRSVIRIAHVLGTSDSPASASEDHQTSQRQLPPPPDYSTVLVEINQSLRSANLSTINSINPSNITINENTHRNDDPSSALTAQDVANILRSSLRRNRTLPVHNNLIEQECTSIQCLVESAAPINQDSIIMLDELKTQQQA